MRSRAFRIAATLLSTLFVAIFLAALPAKAGPVRYGDVVQTIGGYQSGGQSSILRLRSVQQQESSATTQEQQQGGTQKQSTTVATTQTAPQEPTSIIPTVATTQQEGQQGAVETIDQGDIAGTVCDCGEITIPGGWPKWPLLALGVVPCLVVDCFPDKNCPPGDPRCTVCTTCECTGTCPKTVPEPTSLLLLGSGMIVLGTGARRHYARIKANRSKANATEG
ncbi:MAG: PEP-CTERM sorting domain-containing protein [Pyrinomonadaceae bacterium]